ncbi:hypothetical protein B0H17DRAFT_1334553 [Mycena rosella]|uniref:Uncharacterized protein n=1 Tax=Mycena rosella TaxID=1033263 RepID=A0AAD7D2Z7_MYCRO|nr:hypothetical protein B0H17DRAFT_1334553 [Mycena rosella]
MSLTEFVNGLFDRLFFGGDKAAGIAAFENEIASDAVFDLNGKTASSTEFFEAIENSTAPANDRHSIREEVLNASLMEYSIAVLQSAGLNDHTRWNMYIARVVQTFRTELTDVKIEVGASLDQEKADKAVRDAKIKSSNADVQMADATDTIRDAIKAEVTRQTKNFAPPAPVKDSKSAPAPAKRQKQSNTPEAVERHRFELQAKRQRIFFEIEGEAPAAGEETAKEGSRAKAREGQARRRKRKGQRQGKGQSEGTGAGHRLRLDALAIARPP